MKTSAASIIALFFSMCANASPLCSAEDVQEAKTNLAGFKTALDAGIIPLSVYLEHERPTVMAQYCVGEISKESYCRAMIKNWQNQIAIIRDTFDRGMRTAAFEKYIAGMNALQPICTSITN